LVTSRKKITLLVFFDYRGISREGKEQNAMQNLMEIIKKRKSVRTFDENRPIEGEVLSQLEEAVPEKKEGPMNNPVRFHLLDMGKVSGEELRKLGTYGVIKGARFFLIGAVEDNEGALEDAGYCMEEIILKATELGLGTCWLSGTFRRSSFARQIELTSGEILPAISPVGYPAAKKRVVEKLFKIGNRSDKRKPWDKLFIGPDGLSPLPPEEAGVYKDILEAVRLAPSNRNLQPWRIIRDEDGDFHLYLKGRREGRSPEGRIDTQRLDMGIAMCHFSLVAREKGVKGQWDRIEGLRDTDPPLGDLEYVSTWKENSS